VADVKATGVRVSLLRKIGA